MKNNKFIFKNNIYPKYLSKKLLNKFNKKYSKIEKEVSALIDEPENVYNILSGNFTVKQIIHMIKQYKKKVSIKFVKTEIMNQLSYHVESKKIKNKGLILNASIKFDIKETLDLFKNFKY